MGLSMTNPLLSSLFLVISPVPLPLYKMWHNANYPCYWECMHLESRAAGYGFTVISPVEGVGNAIFWGDVPGLKK